MQGQQVPPGSYTITGVIHYESPYQTTPAASKTITLQSSDFQLTINPASTSFAKGSSTALTITATALNGFTGTIAFSATILPAAKHPPTLSPIGSVTLTPNNPSGTSTLTIFTTRSTTTGTYAVTVTGANGTTSHSMSAILMVTST